MMRGAACASSCAPTRVEPVNDSLRTKPESSIACTAGPGGSGTTTFTTPGGTPASARMSATASAVNGVSAAALSTTVQPAASAGPILRVAIAAGKFHGVTSRDTPTGWRVTRIQYAPLGARRYSPSMRTASSEYQRKNSAAYATSAIASATILPFSREISSASSRWRAIISSNALRRISPR